MHAGKLTNYLEIKRRYHLVTTANEEQLKTCARWINESKRGVVFTGAGISTESGIPDFRSPGGLWERFDPSELSFQNFQSNPRSRRTYWEFYRENWRLSKDVKPNRAHLAVASLEKLGKIVAVITQNIDGLHQAAGNTAEKVFELHGNMWEVRCLSCNALYDWEEILSALEEGKHVEDCGYCGGLLKPATVSFGQSLPLQTLKDAQEYCMSCDLLICIGSSLVVYPAAGLPELAKNSGARLVIINRESTPKDRIADLVIRGEVGEVMSEIMNLLDGS
ncbi:MAG: NAD-dependent deacylase [Firmicutes bacterium]|jgi:NAD-dependent deacetylase|nr:NAD-dependent deacylase [Bacillota bacterium]